MIIIIIIIMIMIIMMLNMINSTRLCSQQQRTKLTNFDWIIFALFPQLSVSLYFSISHFTWVFRKLCVSEREREGESFSSKLTLRKVYTYVYTIRARLSSSLFARRSCNSILSAIKKLETKTKCSIMYIEKKELFSALYYTYEIKTDLWIQFTRLGLRNADIHITQILCNSDCAVDRRWS